ncbi:hypothetical protein F511_07542 [Dorcoceras hygrometricum]|uniref:Uncharacterized protein n=1 Tax=Dorcoceras hygrometricum TaxID=472368 RepID=A0A2Z7B4S1_9LAMI|nr:hypothetical protein F511_07542 [Dorcoceras hygrometricum]
MSLEDILLSIPVDVLLPSAVLEFTKTILGKDIKIPGFDERTWYLASLPQIPVDDKGKEPLMEKDPVKGNLVKEQFLLILADIECLVQLREKVIDEAESTGVALQRRKYILLKYRELLIRKFLEARQMNFAPGVGSSGVDLKILDWLTDLHLFVLEELKDQSLAHGLRWEKTCCSKLFEGRTRDRGAVIARSNTNTKSSCWIRTMLRVDGTWAIEPCADYWKPIPREVSGFHILFSRLSTEDIRSFVSSIIFERTALRDVQRSFVSAASQNVRLAFSSVFEDEDDQMDIDQRLDSPTTTADSSMNLIDNDILLGDDATPNQPSLPTVATNLSAFLDNLITSLSERIDSQSEDIERINDSQSDILSKLNTIYKGLRDALLQQGEDLRKLIQNVRQDVLTLDDVQTFCFNEFRKGFLDHSAASTRSVLGKCVYLVTLAMSLFDLQDVRIAIGSLATLDLPIVVDLIGIYGFKGPYCTLTTTNWFLQSLSVIPRGSWGDVDRRSYHDPLGKSGIVIPEPQWLWAHG